MNLTLSIDEKVAEKARAVAQRMGKSLNQLVRDYLADLAFEGGSDSEIAEMRRLSLDSRGATRGWRFDRDSLHERP